MTQSTTNDQYPYRKSMLICQRCFEKTATKTCEDCGAPLCFECHVIHRTRVRKPKKIIN